MSSMPLPIALRRRMMGLPPMVRPQSPLDQFGSDVDGISGNGPLVDDEQYGGDPDPLPPPVAPPDPGPDPEPEPQRGAGVPIDLPKKFPGLPPPAMASGNDLPPRLPSGLRPGRMTENQDQPSLPPPIQREPSGPEQSRPTMVNFPAQVRPPQQPQQQSQNPAVRSAIDAMTNTPPEYQPPKQPSTLRSILATVAGMTPAAGFAPMIAYGPKGLQQMQRAQQYQQSLPQRVEVAKLALEDQKVQQAADKTPTQAHNTVTTDQGIMQFNPDTQRYDIPVGAAPPKEEMMGKTVTTDQGIMMWDPKTKGYNLRVGDSPEKASAEKIIQDEDGNFLRIGADNKATRVTVDGKPLKGKTTEPAAAAKNAFMQTMTKVATEGGLGPSEMGDVGKLTAAIKNSKLLQPEEKSSALAYLAANNTPASTQTAGVARVQVMGSTREYPVMNKQTGELEMRSASEINQSPGTFAPAGAEAGAMGKRAVFEDLHYNIDTARKAITGLASLDVKTRGQLAYALRDTDPKSAVQSFLTGAIGQKMMPEQREAVQSIQILHENAMSLRSVAGMGQGSDELRRAIWATLPSAKSVDKNYMLSQINKFEEVVKRLEGGVPGMKNRGGGPSAPSKADPLGIR